MTSSPQDSGTLNPGVGLSDVESDLAAVPSQRAVVHQGIKWLGFSLGFSRILRLATTVILVRLLAKSDFGVIALANGAILAMSAFREVGFSQALIHRKCADAEDERLSADTVFWILVVTNTLLFGVGFVLTPWIAGWFEEGFTSLVPVLRAMLVLFVIEGLMITPLALLQKRLKFRSVSILEMRATFTYAATAIGCALLGMGVWSLVIGQVVSRGLQAWWLSRIAGFVPRLRWDAAIAVKLFRYGKWLWASSALQAFGRAGDRILLGRIGGGAALGTYGVAFNLCNAPARPVSDVINRVAFPAMTRVSGDLRRVAASLRSALSLVTFAALPAAIGLVLVAEDLIATAYGHNWLDMVPLVRILAFYGCALAIGTIASPVLLATGHPRTLFLIGAAKELLLITLLFTVLSRSEMLSQPSLFVAAAVAIPMCISVIVGLHLAAAACKADERAMIKDFFRALWCATLMALGVILVRLCVPDWSCWLRLLLSVSGGVIIYWVAARVFNASVLSDLKEQLAGMRKSVLPRD